ncbi:MAG TPA: GNAT family N-acetyltransferase [Caulobacteraceae bacterium]|nr:GNAT family N-acetyltransferase [Caulobacteraceae bacterium]
MRPHRLDDYSESAAMWALEQVALYIGGKPSTPAESWARLHRYAGHWTLLGFGYWVVREQATGAFVGEVGFGEFRRGLGERFDGAPEAGWALAPQARGKGYAREALGAALAWCDARPSMIRTVCMIDPRNAASIELAALCGYKEYARTTYREAPSILFERRRPAA